MGSLPFMDKNRGFLDDISMIPQTGTENHKDDMDVQKNFSAFLSKGLAKYAVFC